VLVYATQLVSGGHLNPAITLATAVSGHFHWVTSLFYIVAQVKTHAIENKMKLSLNE